MGIVETAMTIECAWVIDEEPIIRPSYSKRVHLYSDPEAKNLLSLLPAFCPSMEPLWLCFVHFRRCHSSRAILLRQVVIRNHRHPGSAFCIVYHHRYRD